MRRHLFLCVFLIVIMLLASLVISLQRGFSSPEPSPSADPAETPAVSPVQTPEPTPGEAPSSVPTEKPSPDPTPEATPEPTPEVTPVPTLEPTPEPTPGTSMQPDFPQINADSPAVLGETDDMGQDYLDKIIFLGDSTTYALKYYGVLSGGKNTMQVWTPTSGTLTLSYQGFATIVYPDEDVEIPIRDAVERKKPEMMVITLGVNGISFMGHDDFVAEYTDLVTDIMEISPDTKVIIQSIFPVASHYEYLGSINNEKITTANTWLLEIAESTGVRYLDTISVLLGSDGWLPQSLQNGDGLHLNEDGCNRVVNYIRTHGWE